MSCVSQTNENQLALESGASWIAIPIQSGWIRIRIRIEDPRSEIRDPRSGSGGRVSGCLWRDLNKLVSASSAGQSDKMKRARTRRLETNGHRLLLCNKWTLAAETMILLANGNVSLSSSRARAQTQKDTHNSQTKYRARLFARHLERPTGSRRELCKSWQEREREGDRILVQSLGHCKKQLELELVSFCVCAKIELDSDDKGSSGKEHRAACV